MDHRCINCQFLAKKVTRLGLTEIDLVTRSDRNILARGGQPEDVVSLHCYKKVWDERTDLGLTDRTYTLVERERRAQCFFYPYKPNMGFETAEHLQNNSPQPPAEGPSLLGDRGWLMWIVSALVLTASALYVIAQRG